jgi:hypothetical protein
MPETPSGNETMRSPPSICLRSMRWEIACQYGPWLLLLAGHSIGTVEWEISVAKFPWLVGGDHWGSYSRARGKKFAASENSIGLANVASSEGWNNFLLETGWKNQGCWARSLCKVHEMAAEGNRFLPCCLVSDSSALLCIYLLQVTSSASL